MTTCKEEIITMTDWDIFVERNGKSSFIATVNAAGEDDARRAATDWHGNKIGGRYFSVSPRS